MIPASPTEQSGPKRRTILLSASLLFLVVCAFIALKSVRDALFLSRFSIRSLPYFMGINTLVSAAIATVYLQVQRRLHLGVIAKFSFLLFACISIGLWLESDERTRSFAGVLYVWVGIVGTLAPVQAWSLVAKQFMTREAKSIMGILSGSATLGAVAGGFLSRIIAERASASFLILIAGSLYFCAFAACFFLSPSAAEQTPEPSQSSEETKIRKSLIFILLAVVATGTIVSAFIDFQFKTVTQRQLSSSRELAAFFGTFYGTLGILALAVQFLGLSALMKRFRLSLAATILPVLLLGANLVYLVTRLFSSVILLRGTEEVLRHSTDRASMELVYVAMPDAARGRIKGIIETIGIRIPEAAASLVLLMMFTWRQSPLTHLVIVNTVLLCLWAILAFLLTHREYPRMLQDEIHRKQIDPERIKNELFTQDFFRYLPNVLQSADSSTVMTLLELLEGTGKRWLGRYLVAGLQRKEPEIRMKCLEILFDQGSDFSHEVRRLLDDGEPAIRREAVHYICLRGGKGGRLHLKPEDLQDPAVEVASLACRKKGKTLTHQAMNRLSSLLHDSIGQERPDVRVEIAHVLQFVQAHPDVISLYRLLLRDSSQQVRAVVLTSIRRSRPADLIPELMLLVQRPGAREELQEALKSYGDRLLPHLRKILESQAESPARKKQALRIAVDAAGINAFNIVERAAASKNLHLRFQAIKAMNRMQRSHPLAPRHSSIRNLLEREMHQVATELRRMQMLRTGPDQISRRVIQQRLSWAYERVFRLLAILYDSNAVYSAYNAWSSGVAERKDTALELLEQTLAPELRKQILPLLETENPQEEVTTGANDVLLQEYLHEENPLPAAALIHDLPDAELQELEASLEKWTERSHPLIRETLKWRKQVMHTNPEQTTETNPLTVIQKMETLGTVPLFSRLGSEELLVLANQSRELQLAAGTVLFEKGEPSREFYCVVSGRVELVRGSEIVGLYGPGEPLGLSDFLRDESRLLTASARTDSVLLVITHDAFWEALEDYSSVCHGVIQVLARQVDTLTETLTARGELIQ